MSPRRTRAAIVEQSTVSTRSKTQKKNNLNEDAAESIQRTKQSERREKSLNAKKNLKASSKKSTRKKTPDATEMLKKSVRKVSRRKLNLTKEAESDNDVKIIEQNLNMDTTDSIKILRDRHNKISVTEHIKHNLSQSNTSKESNSNKKLQRKTAGKDVKISSIIVTPKSTPPKLSLTPHRSEKTPKKSPISLGSPKTHSLTITRFKSPRKLSLHTISKENLNESDKSYKDDEKLGKTKKRKVNNSSISYKSVTSPVRKSKHKSSDNLKTIVHKFSKSPKIVLRSPKSKKTKKTRKLKLLSPTQKVKRSSIKTPANITSDTTPDLNTTKSEVSTKISPLFKEKNLSDIKCQLLKRLTVSQKKDILAEPIVLLERLSSEKMQNILKIDNKIQSETSVRINSFLNSTFKVFKTSIGSDTFVNQNSSTKLKNRNVGKLINRVSPRIKHNTPIQEKDRFSIPLLSSTPREGNIPLIIDVNLTSNIPIIDNTSPNTRSRHKNKSNMSNIMHKSTDFENVSKLSLFDNDVSDASHIHFSNIGKQDTYDNDNLLTSEKEQVNKKHNTYELEQPQTLSLQQMKIKKRTSTDANLNSRENFKKAKVHFADGIFDISNTCKSIRLQSNVPRNVNIQRNNIRNSAQKSRKVETPKFSQNSLIPPFKTRSSPRTNIVTPRAQLSGIQQMEVTPQTLMEKKSEKKSSTKKIPNFGKIHEKIFAKSESFVDAKKRLEARHLAFTTKKVHPKIDTKKKEKRPLPTDTKDGTHNRFGFKLRKKEATHVVLKKQTTLSREKQQHETRMKLKGVRMNRRFELQMKARNLNP